jgi:hypothetical protein
LVDTTDGLINSWLIRKSPYQQLVVDKELIVDKVVLINKEPYPMVGSPETQPYTRWCNQFVRFPTL